MAHEHNTNDSYQTRIAGALLEFEIGGVQVNFHWAPAGTFMMGSPESEKVDQGGVMKHLGSERQHAVTLTKGFWIAETSTTQELWQAVMRNNPSYFQSSNQLPVEQLNWYDCQDFVEKLNLDYSIALPSGYQYAMPTEAQWEYACRAGTTTTYNLGSDLNCDMANSWRDPPSGTSETDSVKHETKPVKSYAPNAWGVYDMHGNVWDWCADWWGYTK